jgi:D-alanyl-D-alanine carboxypeptidase
MALAAAPPPEVSASAAVLIDQDSGITLYAKIAEQRLYPGQHHKVLTAWSLWKEEKLDDMVTVSVTGDPGPTGRWFTWRRAKSFSWNKCSTVCW